VAYVKLSENTNTGKGFITHGDWKSLSFEGHGDIYKVTGADRAVIAWAERTGGAIYVDEAEALRELKAKEKTAVKAEITELSNRLAVLQSLKTSLEAVI